ncbi:1-acyl-sn-glycerol-3-phosphate acyltransferase [Bacteroides caecigallinarum]|uniref:1-acyl-sn-glycerol-3-phosphate acyltransferase n=1 Tax=Bacteroides TaxID=816 RepID=UPI00195E3717|nr:MULTISPECIES: 1-acyl-sn-glycerol-3-phosphate acyltransferase [Bacteroides]MBM6959332.1 1-acyl-sn-glycerol-3-phosphate acyltransferase [Bacteroides caecigallinarum]MCR8893914.1 1-acyl-sn-glycerol-3-phosphate acyltransferase [Bacteroides sp. ET336]MDN0058411.1 1-acyl-sn-glycerol-3-phosphate acyltransferase [Bacteroides caecigallinarum]
MRIPEEFDEIRPYSPEELPKIFEELLSDSDFIEVIKKVLPDTPIEALANILRNCKTNLDVQKNIFYGLLHDIIKKCSDGFSFDSSQIADKNKGYTFISNHRDIVLDSGFLSVGLIDNGFPTTVEIAIGDNLLIYPWIKKLVRVNKAFIVQRALSMRQMLEASARMSRYIHFAVTQKQENIWIAQREGRAKDSNDRTQDSVLKMLAMGGSGDVIDSLKELNIVPLSLSYEYDPCDFLKAQEMQLKRDVEGFKKSQQDDLVNMQTGIFGYKGRIHFQTGPCINDELEALRGLPKVEIFTKVSEIIDRYIHRNYRMYPANYIACDMLNGNKAMAEHYTAEDKAKFEAYLEKKISLINIPDKDIDFLRERILTMYANPAINHLHAIKE